MTFTKNDSKVEFRHAMRGPKDGDCARTVYRRRPINDNEVKMIARAASLESLWHAIE